MATLSTLTFDGQSDGVDVTLPSGWSTVGVVPVADDAAALHGDRGARYASTATSGRMQYDTGANQSGALWVQSYVRIGTLATANLYLGAVLSLATGGALQGDWRVNTNGTVSIRDGSSLAAGGNNTSSAALAAGTWYRADWMLNDTANIQELRIHAEEAATPLFTLSGAWSSTLTRVLSVGPNAAAASGANLDYDTVRISDAQLGAFAPPAAPVGGWQLGSIAM